MKHHLNPAQNEFSRTDMTLEHSDISVEIWQNRLYFKTDGTLFSPRKPDAGTLAMLSQINLHDDDFILDLGCGYGLIGLAAASKIGSDHVVMVDIDALAVQRSKENARLNHLYDGISILNSDGLSALSDQFIFTKIISHPPYHTDFSVAKRFIEDSFRMLRDKGQLWLVVKRLDWYRNKMRSVFGGVHVMPLNGYYVLMAEKRSLHMTMQNRNKNKKLPRKHLKKMAKKNKKPHHA